jgi:hypothetical protein
MHETHFSDLKTKDEIQALFRSSQLIPFFGSGFTRGEKAKKGRVPDAKELTKIITKLASNKAGISSTEKEEILAIDSLKTAFSLLNSANYILPKQAQQLLENIFSDTDLPNNEKKKLLKIDWPHIFTFNIDDAIERATHRYKTLTPNRKTSREYIASHRCLFKIHGDISDFAAHEDSSLIFTWREYVHSLENNKAMLSFVAEEAKNTAFLFIGCSMDAELDLVHLSNKTPFSKSIYIKKGPTSVSEKLQLQDYGIERVIYFDEYDQIYSWLTKTLSELTREPPIRNLSFDSSVTTRETAIKLIADGGPVYKIIKNDRVAICPPFFVNRNVVNSICTSLRNTDCILVTGRRFSGKTTLLFQTILALKEFGSTFWGSTDTYSPEVKKTVESLENHLFIFDSNCLDSEALKDLLRARIKETSKLILCASSGEAELFRFKLIDNGIKFKEIPLNNILNLPEESSFNSNLGREGLPLYKQRENLLTYAFRCYEEFKHSLGHSILFSKKFNGDTHYILILIAAFGKAEFRHIERLTEYFNIDSFVKSNDRIFEIEESPQGRKSITCNSPAWLLKTISDYFNSDKNSYKTIVEVISNLETNGFTTQSSNLIRFDKLNELIAGSNSRLFIRKIYSEISEIYSTDSHYWLQRAKAELISAQNPKELDDGIIYARKVRLDNFDLKNKTYYSATLVLTQLLARAYKITEERSYLLEFIAPCAESVENYQNNKRHVDDMSIVPEVRHAIRCLTPQNSLDILPHKEKLLKIYSFFGADKPEKI